MGTAILALIGTIIATIIANTQNQSLNQQQYEQQKELMGIQNRMNEDAARKADQRTRALYTDLQSPESMVKQYKDAGLSIGMMYGQGGAGGQLQQGAQSTGVNIPGKNILGMQSMFSAGDAVQTAQIAKTQAEIKNIEADTAAKEADLPLKQQMLNNLKQEVEESKQRIATLNEEANKYMEEQINLAEDTKNKEKARDLIIAQTNWQNAQTALANIDIQSRADINKWTINQLKAQCRNLNAAAAKMELDTKMQQELKEDYYKQFRAQVEMTLKEEGKWDEKYKEVMDNLHAQSDMYKAQGQQAGAQARQMQNKNDYYTQLNHWVDGLGDFMRVLNEDLLGNVGMGIVKTVK